MVVWVIFAILKGHVTMAQRGAEKRQKLINTLDESLDDDLDIAPALTEPAAIRHGDLWWVPVIATAVIAAQAILLIVMR